MPIISDFLDSANFILLELWYFTAIISVQNHSKFFLLTTTLKHHRNRLLTVKNPK